MQRGSTGSASVHKELNIELETTLLYIEQFESNALNCSTISKYKRR